MTAQSEQDAVATQSQIPQLQGVENLQDLPQDTLKNKYGKFQIQRDVMVGAGDFGKAYSTEIEMTPNIRARGSKIDFVQTVRSSINDNWKTTAVDHGWTGETDESGKPIDSEGKPKFLHRSELTEQQTGTGWRVDQSGYSTPFHSEAHLEITPKVGKHHLLKKSDSAQLVDRPTIAEQGYKFDAMSTAMDKKTGKEFGTVEWGFNVGQNEQGEPTLEGRTPTLLEDNLKLDGEPGREARERDRGRKAAYEQCNQAAPGKERANREEANTRSPKQVTRIPIRRTNT
ncbi:hypothetical protein [Nostoc sp. LPT]|uniref:hypothetical protein n=1 Tax=Nostoc sp. LPT TaxID=2815387 RepID=UPI001D79205D|nr:hypothetical protein [Nostoc sp. LPT]MBN4004302.1 hypothetical protein [Nostoc sp. LPT]